MADSGLPFVPYKPIFILVRTTTLAANQQVTGLVGEHRFEVVENDYRSSSASFDVKKPKKSFCGTAFAKAEHAGGCV